MERIDKKELIKKLQQQIFTMQQGSRSVSDEIPTFNGLGHLERAFPNHIFPLGAVHELISYNQEEKAATNGFLSGLISKVNHRSSLCLWVADSRNIFPPALRLFGISPDRVIFVDVTGAKQALWVTEEALKSRGLSIVVTELAELSFTQSRRLQLAVKESQVTGFVHRYQPRTENTVACVSRWRIKPIQSVAVDGLPGPGNIRWNVELLKVRNGKPGQWQIEWTEHGMQALEVIPTTTHFLERKTG